MPISSLVADNDLCIILTTLPVEADATSIANHLVSHGLAACVQCSTTAVTSTYLWKGATATSTEIVLTVKTTRNAVSHACDAIAKLHPYDVPEILVLDVTLASDSYTRWIHESVHRM